jgi:galactosyl transferase GMA12/MNN10 family
MGVERKVLAEHSMKPVVAIWGCGEHYGGMISDHTPRHLAYCEKFGFEFRAYTQFIDQSLNVSWNKVLMLRNLLAEGVPYIVYMDADTMIQNMNLDLREATPPFAWLGLSAHPTAWLGRNFHYNCGVMYIRNVPVAHQFFDIVWQNRGKFEDEQTVMNAMLLDHRMQAGFVTLPHQWNANINSMPHHDAIIAAWHGYLFPPQRRMSMQQYAKTLK